mmetsp:Transcript_21991/g.43703  ORF Transcript_21991/g.43703 Transcript_21991/m.43703 type:complete len:318 (+) Transcript_21991:30-983(+)|eukprot:CAMPEP_0175142128 /NCGR_PEP_ID=MMETSP0087-20121206/12593_1 /TAXON_ID=136419 /ORGANISM="Unknown Unknown, Strain D1" /LENGTH=317 /DNA_ID=CAMNT_0016425829 /DNA_START=26 /DNA_END=979 /DNA_ORIENTATION=+
MENANKKSTVPNVAKKMDPKEQARIAAQIANSKEGNTQIVANETNQTKVLERVGEQAAGEALDLKKIPTVYFNKIQGGSYTIDHRTSKIFIEGVKDTTVIVNGKILTCTIEAWKCENLTLILNTKVKTLQLDISKTIKANFKTVDDFQCCVWQAVDEIDIAFDDKEEFKLSTGFEDVKKKYPDSSFEIDQFIIRILPELGKGLISERCVRLKNGFLSTDREAEDWEKRNTLARDRFMENFLKEGGIHLNKSDGGKKIGPNEPCHCGSKKKFKKCCFGKKQVSGLAEGERELTFNPYKDNEIKSEQSSSSSAPANNKP